MRIHKRVIDLHSAAETVKQIVSSEIFSIIHTHTQLLSVAILDSLSLSLPRPTKDLNQYRTRS